MLETLDLEVWEDWVWGELLDGANQRKAWCHQAVLSAANSGAVVTVREASRQGPSLRFNSDVRTRTWASLAADGACCLLFYSTISRVQIRAFGRAELHHSDAVSAEAWEATPLLSRRCYCAPLAPGTAVAEATSGLPAELESREPTWEESLVGEQNFGVVRVRAERLDVMRLNFAGHRRAEFSYTGEGVERRWLVP